MPEIFVSYSRSDAAWARRVAEALQGRGRDVWWDLQILPGQTWDSVVENALTEAGCVIVLWSAASVASESVKEEAAFAKRRRVLLPVRVEEVEPPLGFSLIEGADLWNWTGDLDDPEFTNLLRAIDGLLGPPADAVLDAFAEDSSREELAQVESGAPPDVRLVAVPSSTPVAADVRALFLETDTELVLSAPAVAVEAELEPLPEPEAGNGTRNTYRLGTAIGVKGDPLQVHLIVHALDRDPTSSVDAVRGALEAALAIATEHGADVVRTPLIGSVHGGLPSAVAARVLREVLVQGEWPGLKKVYVTVAPGHPLSELAPLLEWGLNIDQLGGANQE